MFAYQSVVISKLFFPPSETTNILSVRSMSQFLSQLYMNIWWARLRCLMRWHDQLDIFLGMHLINKQSRKGGFSPAWGFSPEIKSTSYPVYDIILRLFSGVWNIRCWFCNSPSGCTILWLDRGQILSKDCTHGLDIPHVCPNIHYGMSTHISTGKKHGGGGIYTFAKAMHLIP